MDSSDISDIRDKNNYCDVNVLISKKACIVLVDIQIRERCIMCNYKYCNIIVFLNNTIVI